MQNTLKVAVFILVGHLMAMHDNVSNNDTFAIPCGIKIEVKAPKNCVEPGLLENLSCVKVLELRPPRNNGGQAFVSCDFLGRSVDLIIYISNEQCKMLQTNFGPSGTRFYPQTLAQLLDCLTCDDATNHDKIRTSQ